MTERKLKNYNKSLDKQINDTMTQLYNSKIYSKKGLANDNLYNIYEFDQKRTMNKYNTPRKYFDNNEHMNSNSSLTLKFNDISKIPDG